MITMPDARTTADHIMVRLELIAERLDLAVAELRDQTKRLADMTARDEGGADDDRADGDDGADRDGAG